MPRGKTASPIRERKFVKELVRNGGNKTQAMLEVNPDLAYSSANKESQRMMKRPRVQMMVEEALQANKVDPQWWVARHKSIIDEGTKEDKIVKAGVNEALKSLSALGELMFMGKGKVNSNVNFNVDLNLPRGEVLKKRQELHDWFSDIVDVN